MAIYFYTQIFVRDGLAVDFGLCRIWRDHGRDFSRVTSGSDGIPSDPVGIDRDPAKSRVLIPLGSR